MGRALAIETSGKVGSIALCEFGRVLNEEEFAHGLAHAAEIIPIIDRLCRAGGWGPQDIEQVYVSAGAGSFTGLRIAVTLAKTLALSSGAKIVAVPTVRVLAENGPGEVGNLIIVLDAKRDQIFTARFSRVGSEWREEEEAHLDTLVGMLERASRPVYLLGEGLPYHEKFIDKADSSVISTEPESWRARASVVARLGWEMAKRGEFSAADALAPIYIRRPEAEEKWENKMTR